MSAPKALAEPTLFAAVLAAGQSLRFGSTKLLAEYRGRALAAHAIRAAEAVCDERTLLVTGNDWRQVHEVCQPLMGFLVINEHFAKGMSASIAAAVRALPDTAGGILLMLGDQPLVTADDLNRLVTVWRRDPESIVCSRFGSQLTPPAIFPARLFDELTLLSGDQGARPVIERHADGVVPVDIPHAEFDVDTPEALNDLADSPD